MSRQAASSRDDPAHQRLLALQFIVQRRFDDSYVAMSRNYSQLKNAISVQYRTFVSSASKRPAETHRATARQEQQ